MRDAIAYYILCRVWQYCLEQSLWDAMDTVYGVKSKLIAESDWSQDAFQTALNCFCWSKQLTMNVLGETEVVTCG